MKRGSSISLLLGLGAFVVIGFLTKNWGYAAAIGLGLAGFGGLGTAGLNRRGTMPGQGPSQGPGQQPTQPTQPKSPGRSNEI